MCTATLETTTCSGIGSAAPAQAPAEKLAVSTRTVPLPAELLDGGEVVILTLKPSLWFVLFDSAKWIVAGAVVMVGASVAGLHLEREAYAALFQGTVVVLTGRVGLALLRWVSRFYLLTNRRIVRIHGVLQARTRVIALTDVMHTRVCKGWHERLLGLGTLHFACEPARGQDTAWPNLADPDQVHAQVRRAIERAIDRQLPA